ncbi:MAG: peptide ABC transporter substrate-binding protein [Proteobacteria bacterium]|nr:MAG: peptide ABC transporter substrate-binding protein [Pseudomonadota bacterium]
MTKITDLEHALKTGQLSRRDFIKLSSALGLSAAMPALFLNPASAAEPQKGGHLKIGTAHGATTDTLDPATPENNFLQVLCKTIHNYLTTVDADGKLYPELAESWESDDSAKIWTFKLRKGVEFHNGQPLKAADVLASLNYHRAEDSKSSAKIIVDPLVDLQADGDDTVVMTLREGNADWPYLMSDYHLAIMPANADGQVDAKSGIGCGYYTLKSFEPGVKAEFERFTNHWNAGASYLDTAELLTIADVTARVNALITGEIDVADRMDVKTLHLLQRNRNIRIIETSGNAHYSIPMRCDVDPYSSVDVRLALKYAVDREAMLKTVLHGHGYVGNDHPIGRGNRYLDTHLEQRTYDPDKAKFHLKKAGAEGLKVQLSTADAAFAGAVDAAIIYKEHAAKAGIDVEVVREPNDGYWSNVWLKKPFCFCYWGGRPTEDWMFSIAYAKDAEWNDAVWDNKRFNKLLLEARAELDEAKRAEMYAEMQALVRDDGGTIIPVFNNYINAISNKVGTPEKIANDWDLDGQRAIIRWWKV